MWKFQNYISEECATVSVGISYLQSDMGLDFLRYIKDDGSDFLKACDFLNKKSDGTKEADICRPPCQQLLGLFAEAAE